MNEQAVFHDERKGTCSRSRGVPGRRSGSGFTLIELLVVISIIAVLAGMLLPAIRIIREKARSIVCSKTLANMQLANIAYAGEYEGAFVPGLYCVAGNTWVDLWYSNSAYLDMMTGGRLENGQYWAIPASFLCPVARRDPAYTQMATSYGYNNTYTYPYPAQTAVGARTSRGRLSSTVAFMDTLDWNVAFTAVVDSFNSTWPEGSYETNRIQPRHAKSANVVYFDGHVRACGYSDLNLSTAWQ